MKRKLFQNCRRAGISLFAVLLFMATKAQTPPAFPPSNVTSADDWAQMRWQLGIVLPTLPSKVTDPNRDPNSTPRSSDLEGDYNDPYGFQLTRSSWGLWTQYSGDPYTLGYTADSLQLGLYYTPINLLKALDGTNITTQALWQSKRRPEIDSMCKTDLWGKIPADSILPAVTWSVGARTSGGTGAAAYYQFAITGYIDSSRYPAVRNKPRISATLRVPQSATGPVPIMIAISTGSVSTTHWNACYPKGWGVCSFNCGLVQPDNGAGLSSYLIGLCNKGNWRKPDDWGALGAWSWGVSRLIDLFETYEYNGVKLVNSQRIGVTGHSRWGKAALVTMAYEPRLAIGFPSCSGALGIVQSQRHWGEELELVAGSGEYHWVAGNVLKYCGELTPGVYKPRKVENLKVDGHSLLSLVAPRPVFINGGKPGDSWQDPYGAYLSAALATPVWELFGINGLIMTDKDTLNRYKPILDKNYVDGKVAYRKHSVGGHADTQDDWYAFMNFAVANLPDILPVNYKSFTGQRKNKTNSLEWVTATEQNNRGFRVQKKNGDLWEDISFVPSLAAGGNATHTLTYHFEELNTSTMVTQYRLVQENFDGKKSYSSIVLIKGLDNSANVLIYPNPSPNGNLSIIFNTASAKDVTITDMSGKLVKTYRNVSNNMSVVGLTTGTYTIKITDRLNGDKTSQKVIIK